MRGELGSVFLAGSAIAPTTEIAEIALVSDISGVCSSGETRRISSKPRTRPA